MSVVVDSRRDRCGEGSFFGSWFDGPRPGEVVIGEGRIQAYHSTLDCAAIQRAPGYQYAQKEEAVRQGLHACQNCPKNRLRERLRKRLRVVQGVSSWKEAAKRIGIQPASLAAYRKRHGIPAYLGPRWCQGLNDEPHLARAEAHEKAMDQEFRGRPSSEANLDLYLEVLYEVTGPVVDVGQEAPALEAVVR